MGYWSCVQLEPNRTRLALYSLGLNGYPTYCPRIRTARKLDPDDSPLLFPSYAFLVIEAQWHSATRSPGVARLLLHDDRPARVPDHVITDLRGREVDGLIQLAPPPPRLQRGDPVKIAGGLFAGEVALFETMKPRARVEVLLGWLGHLELPRRDVLVLGQVPTSEVG